MVDVQLFINSISVDLLSDEDIQLCFQVNNLGDLQSFQNNYTKAFKLPITQKNREIFGFPDDPTITTGIPYTQMKAKLIVDGVEIIPNGVAEIIDVQNDIIDITVLSGNCDFLDLLPGQIYDMGDSTSVCSQYGAKLLWKQYDHVFNVQNAAYSQKNTSGWIYPIVSYGVDLNIIPPFAGPINVRTLRPGFFLHTAIELLVESTGYTIDYEKSSLVKDPIYNLLIVQFANGSWDHGSDYQNTPDLSDGFNTVLGLQLTIAPQTFYNNPINFKPVGKYNGTYYNPGNDNINGTVTVGFNCTMYGNNTSNINKQSQVHIYISVREDTPDSEVTDLAQAQINFDANATQIDGTFYSEKFYSQTVSVDVQLVPGMNLFVRYDVDRSQETLFIMEAGATFAFVVDQVSVLWQQTVQCERIFPDVSQLDLLKDTLQRHGQILIADPNSGTIIFISFADIIANKPVAKDWSLKLVDNGKQINFEIGNYSQINWLRYQPDSSIPVQYLPLYYADDNIPIADKTLNPTTPQSDLFDSIFAPTLNQPWFGGTIAQICSPTNTEDFAVGSSPRILVDQKLDISAMGTNGQSLTVPFTDNTAGYVTEKIEVNDIVSVPYFYKPGGKYNLCWCDKGGQQGLKNKYYQEFANILNQTKQITVYFMVMPYDIASLDFSIPIYLRQLRRLLLHNPN